MIGPHTSPIVGFAARIQAPLLQLYAAYVLLHGHYSPGGGFQAGAALAASFLIPRLVGGTEHGQQVFSTRAATVMAVLGVMVYAGTGLLSLVLADAPFLDYAALEHLPWPMPAGAATRAIGTLTVEIGVSMTVAGVMVMLFDDLIAPAVRETEE